MTECRTVTRLARGSTTWSTAPPPSSPWSSSGRPWMGGGPTPTSSSRPRTPASPRGPPTPRPRCPRSPPPCLRASTPSSTMTPCPYLTTTTTSPISAISSRTLLTPQVRSHLLHQIDQKLNVFFSVGNSYTPTTPVFATKSETCDSPVSQYVSVSELSPSPASPETATPAHVEAMLTTLQPFNPTGLVSDNQGNDKISDILSYFPFIKFPKYS